MGSPNKILRLTVEHAREREIDLDVDKNLKDAAARAEQVQAMQIKEEFTLKQKRKKKRGPDGQELTARVFDGPPDETSANPIP